MGRRRGAVGGVMRGIGLSWRRSRPDRIGPACGVMSAKHNNELQHSTRQFKVSKFHDEKERITSGKEGQQENEIGSDGAII